MNYIKIEELQKEYDKDGGDWRITKMNELRNQIVKVTMDQTLEVKELLTILGIPVIQSPGDAEKTCGYLQGKGLVHYTVTDDTDAFTFNIKKVIKFKQTGKCLNIWDLDIMLRKLDLNYNEFVDLCILAGCDYCPTIPRIGIISAFNLIKTHRNIETILKNNPHLNLPDKYLEQFYSSRKIFMNNEDQQLDNTTLVLGELNKDRMITYLSSKKYEDKTIKNMIKKTENARNHFYKNFN